MKRCLIAFAAVALATSVFAQKPEICKFSVGNDSFLNGMSPNGKWATFERQAGEEEVTFDVQIIDLATGKVISYTPEKMINYRGKEEPFVDGSYSQPFGVSDDGKTVYGSVNGYPAYFTVDDLTWHCLSMGSTADNRNLSGAVYGMSQDGKRKAGWFAGTSMTELKSALWEDDQIRMLKNLPTYKDMYDLGIIDYYDYQDQKDLTPNYTFRTISSDGSKMVVGIDHNRPKWGCSYGIYDLDKETFTFILAPQWEYGLSFTDSAYMSNNGEWVTGTMYFLGDDPEGYEDHEGVYRFHVPTEKLEVFSELQDRNILATAIDNKGTILGGTPSSQPMRNMVIFHNNLWVDLGKILEQKYNINYYTTTGYDNSGYPVGVSSDGKTVLSQAEFRGGAFALTLPVEFSEAAEGTSLLTEYMVSPVAGKKFSRLKDIIVRFSYSCVPSKDAKVIVTDEDGNKVGESKEFTPFSSQNILYTVTFPDIDMAEGKKYNVNIPAGTFVVDGTTMGNPEINISYTGRASTPVKSIGVTPEKESFINVFSYNNPVIVMFDADLALSTAVHPQLFEEGRTEPLCNLSVTADGANLFVYPASERRLAKDRNYRIEIPAAIVTDLGGVGANEAFSLAYKGAFVPTPVEDPARPFFENFESPNEAIYNFLMIDGDANMPSEEMAGLGFDQYNTPWNFSVRDEGSVDYCAASHSMYSPAGQSDDWMMIPQLKINDKDYYLTFKGQSYLSECVDKLKIVVWEYNDVISQLDDELLKKAKKEAKTLAEVQLVPSKTEGLLEDSWTTYEFSLADYAGKNVYIGFVNENRDQSAIFLDDIAVECRGAYTLSVATEPNLIEADKTEVMAYINVSSATPLTNLVAELNIPALSYTKTIRETDLSLTAGQRYTVTFPDVPVEKGVVNQFTLSTTLGGLTQTYTGKVVNHAFEINRRVLIEEGTGMWCGNCPYGEVTLDHLQETMPDNIAVISVHNGDALALTDYDNLLALGGYPNGRIDRLGKVYAPMYNDNHTGEKNFISPSGDKTFKDMVLSELSNASEGEIKFGDVTYFSGDNAVELPLNLRFSVNRENVIYNIFTCVVENGLSGRQTNYFAGANSPIMEWWTLQPGTVDYTYNNVARAMIGGFYGQSNLVPTAVKAGEVYNARVAFVLPSNISNPENMHFVVALLDGTSGRVVNSDVCKVFAVNPTPGASSVEEIAAGASTAELKVDNGCILINGSADVEVYTTSGMRVRNNNLIKGIYLVRKVMADGSVFNGSIVVR